MRRAGSGRRLSLSSYDESFLRDKNRKDPKMSAVKLTSELRMVAGAAVCSQTVRNALVKRGLYAGVTRKIPLFSQQHIDDRFRQASTWSNRHISKWKSEIFLEETKLNLFRSDGRSLVWKKPVELLNPEYFQHTTKYGGGSLMVWGCMSYKGVSELVINDGTINSIKY